MISASYFSTPEGFFSNSYSNYASTPSSSDMTAFLPYFLGLLALGQSASRVERDTGPFETVYSWNQLDFEYDSGQDKAEAMANKRFVPENNLPLGLEVFGDRLFISMPKWKEGVPASLAELPRAPQPGERHGVALRPFPGWHMHVPNSCNSLTSVFRMKADSCGRLWVLDSGLVNVLTKSRQVCPPSIFVFDLLHQDRLLLRYELPPEFVKQDSLFSNIAVDVEPEACGDAHAYISDVWRFGIIVFSLRKMKSWRVTDHLFFPDPLAAAYSVQGLDFEWTDGVFAIAVGPRERHSNDRPLYFHPMSSFREFHTTSSVLKNETGWEKKDSFRVLGQSRGPRGQSSASGMDRRGVLFFNLVARNAVGCWDSRKPYKRHNLGVVASDEETLVFPNDLKVDQEERQSVWVLSNRLPIYLYKNLEYNTTNFRVMRAHADEAVANTVCDPQLAYPDSFDIDFQQPDCL